MANSKSEQHIIPLADPDLNRQRLKGEVVPWQGFNDRNSPFISGECLPLYTKTITGTDQWTAPNLDVYKIQSNHLTKNGVAIGPELRNGIELSPVTAPTEYPYILCGTRNARLCAKQGQDGIVVVDALGTVSDPIYYGEGFSWGECVKLCSIHFSSRTFAFTWGDKCYVQVGSNFLESSVRLSSTGSDVCIFNTSNKVYFTRAHGSYIVVFDYNGNSWSSISSMPFEVTTRGLAPTLIDSGNITVSSMAFDVFRGVSLKLRRTSDLTRTCAFWMMQPGGQLYPYEVEVTADYLYGHGELLDDGTIQIYDTDRIICWPNKTTYQGQEVALLTVLDPLEPGYNYARVEYDENIEGVVTTKTYSRYGVFETVTAFKDIGTDGLFNVQFVASSQEEGLFSLPLYDNNWNFRATACDFPFQGDSKLNVLFNYGQVFNISISEGLHTRGSILFPWASINDVFIDGFSGASVKDSLGNWYDIINSTPTYTVFKDRYILLNTASFWNAYDLEKDLWLHYADDWNNRLRTGWIEEGSWAFVNSQTDSEYIQTRSIVPGAAFQPGVYIRYQGSLRDAGLNPIAGSYAYPTGFSTEDNGVDFYVSYVSTDIDNDSYTSLTPTYFTTYLNDFVDRGYENSTWVFDDTLLNVPLNTRFQTDLYTLITLPDTTSTIALQQQGLEILSYYQGTNDNSFKRLCCVQSMFYGLTDDGIYQIDLLNGVISNAKKIVNITGLMYVAYTPLCIYFYNQSNRSTYIFTGDASIKPIVGCSSFTRIGQCKFKPDTLETFMITNAGVFVSAAEYCYRIPNKEPSAPDDKYTDVFFTDYGFALKTPYSVTCYSYYPATGHTRRLPMMIETKLFGAGNNVITTTDCIYLRFFKGDSTGDVSVKISGQTLTDLSTPLQTSYKEYVIHEADWDTDTQTYYLRYQPTYQKGLGMSIRVESDVPLIYMGFGSKPETLQITK